MATNFDALNVVIAALTGLTMDKDELFELFWEDVFPCYKKSTRELLSDYIIFLHYVPDDTEIAALKKAVADNESAPPAKPRRRRQKSD